MCGAGLDASAKAEEPSERKSGRVRQRTMSKPGEISSAVNRIREEMSVEIPASEPSGSVSITEAVDETTATGAIAMPYDSGHVEGGDLDDPLSAYIEEVEVPEETPPVRAGKNGAHRAESPIRQGFVGPSKGSDPEEFDAPVKGFSPPEDHEPAPVEAPPAIAEETEQPKPKVIIESGPRKFNRGGLSFGGKGRQEAKPVKAQEEETAEASFKPEKRAEPTSPPPRTERRNEERHSERHEDKAETRSTPDSVRESEKARSIEIPRRSVNNGGRLAGWLVNFPEGADSRAVELREGKFFITRSRVKETDLVIDDRSVSTPHALCAVGSDNKMRVQDLMSDGGVFVRRRGESEYIRITETAELDHGDWVRFGTMEYNVCLIAHVGVK